MATTAATNAIAESTITSPRRLAYHSMSLAIMAASVPVPGRHRAGSARVGADPGDRGLEPALGIDEERGARDHGVALGEPAEHGDAVAVAAAGPHPTRLEPAAAPR